MTTAADMTDAMDKLLLLIKRHRAATEHFRTESMVWKSEYEALKSLVAADVTDDQLVEAKNEIARLRQKLLEANDELQACDDEYCEDMTAAKGRIASLEADLKACRDDLKRARESDATEPLQAPVQKRAKNEVLRDITYDHVSKGPDGKLILSVSDDDAGITPTDVSVRFVDKINPAKRTYRSWYVVTDSGSVFYRSFVDVARALGAAA